MAEREINGSDIKVKVEANDHDSPDDTPAPIGCINVNLDGESNSLNCSTFGSNEAQEDLNLKCEEYDGHGDTDDAKLSIKEEQDSDNDYSPNMASACSSTGRRSSRRKLRTPKMMRYEDSQDYDDDPIDEELAAAEKATPFQEFEHLQQALTKPKKYPTRKYLTLEQKIAIIRCVEEGKMAKRKIAALHNIPHTTLFGILKKKEMFLNEWNNNVGRNAKRIFHSPYRDMEADLYQWYCDMKTNGEGKIPDVLIKAQAKEFARALGHATFAASTGWLHRFKKRYRLFARDQRESSVAERLAAKDCDNGPGDSEELTANDDASHVSSNSTEHLLPNINGAFMQTSNFTGLNDFGSFPHTGDAEIPLQSCSYPNQKSTNCEGDNLGHAGIPSLIHLKHLMATNFMNISNEQSEDDDEKDGNQSDTVHDAESDQTTKTTKNKNDKVPKVCRKRKAHPAEELPEEEASENTSEGTPNMPSESGSSVRLPFDDKQDAEKASPYQEFEELERTLKMSHPKRKTLTLEKKIEIIHCIQEGKFAKRRIATMFHIPHTTLFGIWRKKDIYLNEWNSNIRGSISKKRRIVHSPYSDINEELYKWHCELKASGETSIPDVLIKAQALEFARNLGHKTFTASGGWLHGFKTRYRLYAKDQQHDSKAAKLPVAGSISERLMAKSSGRLPTNESQSSDFPNQDQVDCDISNWGQTSHLNFKNLMATDFLKTPSEHLDDCSDSFKTSSENPEDGANSMKTESHDHSSQPKAPPGDDSPSNDSQNDSQMKSEDHDDSVSSTDKPRSSMALDFASEIGLRKIPELQEELMRDPLVIEPSCNDQQDSIAEDSVPESPETKPKRRDITLQKKVKILEFMAQNQGKKPLSRVAADFGIPKSSLCGILKYRDKIWKDWCMKVSGASRKPRISPLDKVERKLCDWIYDVQEHHDGTIKDSILKAKALEIAREMGNHSFGASAGWCYRFKRRNGLAQKSFNKTPNSEENMEGNKEGDGDNQEEKEENDNDDDDDEENLEDREENLEESMTSTQSIDDDDTDDESNDLEEGTSQSGVPVFISFPNLHEAANKDIPLQSTNHSDESMSCDNSNGSNEELDDSDADLLDCDDGDGDDDDYTPNVSRSKLPLPDSNMHQLRRKPGQRLAGAESDILLARMSDPNKCMFDTSQNKRKSLTLEMKIDMLRCVDEGKKNRSQIAADFGVPQSTLNSIVSRREKIMKDYCKNLPLNKRISVPQNEDMESELFKWICGYDGPLKGSQLKEKAISLARDMGNTRFKASDGWLHRFKIRFGFPVKTANCTTCGLQVRACKCSYY